MSTSNSMYDAMKLAAYVLGAITLIALAVFLFTGKFIALICFLPAWAALFAVCVNGMKYRPVETKEPL